MKTKKTIVAVVLTACALTLLAIGVAAALPGEEKGPETATPPTLDISDMVLTGPIVSVESDFVLMLDETRNEEFALIMQDLEVINAAGEPIDFLSLQEGDRLQVIFSGATTRSLPPQPVGVTSITLLPE